jgi:hypothetical protein
MGAGIIFSINRDKGRIQPGRAWLDNTVEATACQVATVVPGGAQNAKSGRKCLGGKSPPGGRGGDHPDEGGRRAAAIYTLIETAKLNDVDPQAWLADVLAHLPDHPAKRIADLLPWNWRAQNLAAKAA